MIYNILLNNVLRNNVRLFQFHSRGKIKSAAGSAVLHTQTELRNCLLGILSEPKYCLDLTYVWGSIYDLDGQNPEEIVFMEA